MAKAAGGVTFRAARSSGIKGKEITGTHEEKMYTEQHVERSLTQPVAGGAIKDGGC